MIRIINTGNTDGDGRHGYKLFINNDHIADFTHHRPDGLGECLRRAGEAADMRHKDYLAELTLLAAQEIQEWTPPKQ